MGKYTSKGRGRAGVTLPHGETRGQVAIDAAISDGNGQAGGTGLETPGVSSGQSKASLQELVKHVTEHNLKHSGSIIVRIWHPSIKDQQIIATNYSDVQALTGESSYQLSTGEITKF